ncbi:MAG: 3-dehydroquinate synthase, partial [Gammaproteobacteria bacterium]|nr:3-dehydroquinate synthase [Gammaproteobacteria bacterium]
MVTIEVGLGVRSYPIHIGAGLLERSDILTAAIPGRDVLVVTNTVVAPLYLERVCNTLSGYRVRQLVLPDGEAHKTLETAGRILDALVTGGYARDATVLALGGGVVGDMAGFAAACYQRGIAYLQTPTTLLAQVDSAVGGKTAVNHPQGKNLIGAFHQPIAVIADTDTLNTLPERELRAGLAEVIKYGAIMDAPFLDWLQANMSALLERDPQALAEAIRRSCELKARIVEMDEREQG